MMNLISSLGLKEAFQYITFLFWCYIKINVYCMFLLFDGVSHLLFSLNTMIDDILYSNNIPLNFTLF